MGEAIGFLVGITLAACLLALIVATVIGIGCLIGAALLYAFPFIAGFIIVTGIFRVFGM